LAVDEEWRILCQKLEEARASQRSVRDFADALGLRDGVSGYAYHTVPVALYAWLRHPGNFREGLTDVLNCGGDTDSLGAIVGALIGAQVGVKGIPPDWLGEICEWPRSLALLGRIADGLARQRAVGIAHGKIPYFWPGLLVRNPVFLIAVAAHGLRRLAPPY